MILTFITSSCIPVELWTDSCSKTATFMFLPLTAYLLYSLPTIIFVRRVDDACDTQPTHTNISIHIYTYYIYNMYYIYYTEQTNLSTGSEVMSWECKEGYVN